QPILTNVLVENVAAEGKSIAKVDGKVIFIEQTVPGDIVDIQIIKSKKDWAEAYPIAFKQYSPNRVNPFCSHFGVCGGCQWQMLPCQLQLQHKQQQVTDHLTRIGKIVMPPIAPIIGAANTQAYRNKIEYTFATRRFIPKEEFQQLKKQYPEATANEIAAQVGGAAGFHAKGMFDKVVKIDKCYLQNNLGNQIRDAITELAQQYQIPFYDIKSHVGFLRNVMIRITEIGEVMVNLVVGASNTKWESICTNYLKQHFPAITSLYLTVNTKFNDSIFDLNPKLVYGKPYVLERLEDFQFKISPKSFFQTNTQQALQLYKVTREFAELTGNEVLYDLYCGTGSIGIFCSKQVQKIVGVEVVADAIEDAKENAAF
ncbi:MAG: class I SAM-dependent RNA methyltransferase, partial [Chitinophagaceae bacterium]